MQVARTRLIRISILATFASWAGMAFGDEGPSVTPYRPSVSTPAALSAPGWMEVEAGVLHARADDPTTRDSLPYTLKLAFTPDWGLRVGGDAFVRQVNLDGSSARGLGDTAIVLKRRFALDESRAFGLELGAKAPSAHAGLGSGHPDYGINGIYSADFASTWHTDINLNATHLGGSDPLASPWQGGWAAALSRSLAEPWGVTGELSGTSQRGASRTRQWLLAGTYAASRSLALDFGSSKGLNAASGSWSFFAGATFLAFRVD